MFTDKNPRNNFNFRFNLFRYNFSYVSDKNEVVELSIGNILDSWRYCCVFPYNLREILLYISGRSLLYEVGENHVFTDRNCGAIISLISSFECIEDWTVDHCLNPGVYIKNTYLSLGDSEHISDLFGINTQVERRALAVDFVEYGYARRAFSLPGPVDQLRVMSSFLRSATREDIALIERLKSEAIHTSDGFWP